MSPLSCYKTFVYVFAFCERPSFTPLGLHCCILSNHCLNLPCLFVNSYRHSELSYFLYLHGQSADLDWYFSEGEVVTILHVFGELGYGYTGARSDTTQQSGQTPDKEAEIKDITVYVRVYTETDSNGMLSPPGFTVAANINSNLDVCLSVHRCIFVEKKNQLDVTVCTLLHLRYAQHVSGTCAHHQEL